MFSDCYFEAVISLQYLSTSSSEDLDMKELTTRILVKNRAYFALHQILEEYTNKHTNEFRICETLIRPLLINSNETWTLNN